MNFSDAFKKSFIEGYSGDLNILNIFLSLSAACLLAVYVFFIYKFLTRKTFYSKNFNISLAALAVITTAIILTVQSNIVISLGMVGALSIVRFRTAIKDPIDLTFLFWSIGIGIMCGAGLANIAAITSLILTVGIFVLEKLPISTTPMILTVNADSVDADEKINNVIKQYCKYYKVKSKTYLNNNLDMVVEVFGIDEKNLMKSVMSVNGVTAVSIISHDGEVSY